VAPHLHSAVVVVSDQELALDFYTRVLGWVKREDNQMSEDYRFLVVVPPGHSTGVVLGPEHIHGRSAPVPTDPQDTDIYLVTDDLAADYERWTAQGVVFEGPPEPMPWGGLGARFCDPFGNRFFITDGA
jgi:predicted enzyme related to lactoylglutathione lyase